MPDKEKCERFMKNLSNNVLLDMDFTKDEVAYIKDRWSSLVIVNGCVQVMTWNKKNEPVFTKPK